MAESREAEPRIQDDDDVNVDEELELMQARLAEMEEEKNKLAQGDKRKASPVKAGSSTPQPTTSTSQPEDQPMEEDQPEAVDARSVYIGNVDYAATPEEIQAHFQACGTINRVTILCDKFTGHPKGYAYVEFADPSVVQNALVLNESMFRSRLLSVKEKRTNIPGLNMTNRGRGRGRGAGRGFRGGFHPYRARGRGRGRGF